MDLQLLSNIIGVLKLSTDKTVILKGLLKLRSDVVKNNEGIILFREAGGIPVVIRFLGKPWEQILEVSLSIMGNCCTEEVSCREALNNKVVGQLITILKCHPSSSIQCRACRLLGNLAKADVAHVMSVNGSSSIAKTVCSIIKDTKDIATRIMAFRACRFLMGDMQFSKHFLSANGFYIALSNLTDTLKTKAQNENGNEETLLNDAQQHQCYANDAKIGLKQSQHREKYFEEVARNLEGVRSDIWDQVVFKNAKRSDFTSHRYAIPKDKAAIDLVCEMLKCLLVLSDLQIDSTVWESLCRASCTLAPIVYFIQPLQNNNKHQGAALRILSNFSKNRGSFYMLSSADAITAACELLVNTTVEKPLSNHDTRYCINIITMLSVDACNRSKIRRSGALKNLIAVLRDSKSSTEKACVLCIFLNFQYDDMSMELMIREGLVGILIKELNHFISSDEEYYKRKREEKLQLTKKRKLNATNPNQMKAKCKLVKMKDECCNYDCYDSPTSSPRSQITPSSPCSSRSMSPMADTLYSEKDPDEDSYSPVCSDEDDDDDNQDNKCKNLFTNPNGNKDDNHTILMHLLDQASRSKDNALLSKNNDDFDDDKVADNDVDDDNDNAEDEVLGKIVLNENIPAIPLPQIGNLPHNTIDIIENLLFRVTCTLKKSFDLGKLETLNTLIKAIRVFGGNNMDFTNTLTNILTESQFFGQIIRHGIPYQVYQLTKTDEVKKDGITILDTLTSMGECNYGKEELFRLLRCDCHLSQNRAAIAVGFIIRNKSLLYQFLNDSNVLGILLSIALANTDNKNLNAEAADAITCMSRFSLDIKVPTIDVTQYNECKFNQQIKLSDELLHKDKLDMRFLIYEELSSNSLSPSPVIVPFNKAILCSCSEVFNTMLNSDFREGNDGEIHLRSCTANGLRYFLQLLTRISKQMNLNVIPPENQHYALLEAFEMSRIYIIPEMEQYIQDILIGTLNETNCLSVFEWAIKNYHVELTDVTISYYLSALLNSDIKLKLFHAADCAHYSSQWFQMLNDTILTKCYSYVIRP